MYKNVLKKLKFNKRKIFVWTSIILVFSFGISFFSNSINSIISSTVELESKSLATQAINSAIADVVMNTIMYEDLVNVVTDDFGSIVMIQANSLEINNLSKELAQTAEKKIYLFGMNAISIPIGSFTGIPLLVGRGPSINLMVDPVGAVTCTFLSVFETAGINQTSHKIYIRVNAIVGVVMPLLSAMYESNSDVLICESIIVGQVPEVYLNSDSLDTLLNFVPY